MSHPSTRTLMWFRSDLRTTDNPAFAAASRAGEVVAVFAICPEQWRQHDWGSAKVDFILRSVVALADELAQLRVPLRILQTATFAKLPDALLQLAKQTQCDALRFNMEYEVNEQRRDDRVLQVFADAELLASAHHDQTILPPTSLRTQQDRPYTVYTPYRKAWLKQVRQQMPELTPAPRKQRDLAIPSDAPPTTIEGFEPRDLSDSWPAGQHEAQRRLTRFIKHHIADYHAQRDLPAAEATSTLSPYLACGAISARQCLLAAAEANDGQLDAGDVGAVTWIGELIWREFYRQVLVHFPHVSMHRPFKPQARRIAWREDDEQFARWCQGRTGVPIVDAAMRQLHALGWMHNRLRMIVAMYLSKDLLIDWRRGERFFMQHLVDGDLANNNGGWQWAASTGTDATPYFRVFNPVTQSRRYDPQGTFIRHWCPELAALDARTIHDPSQLPSAQREMLNWPEPMVDHAAARKRAIKAFGRLKNDADST